MMQTLMFGALCLFTVGYAAKACMGNAQCSITELCSGGLCVPLQQLSECPCIAPKTCAYDKWCVDPVTTPTTTVTTTPAPTKCKNNAGCKISELCHNEVCTALGDLNKCNATVPCADGECQYGYCVKPTTTSTAASSSTTASSSSSSSTSASTSSSSSTSASTSSSSSTSASTSPPLSTTLAPTICINTGTDYMVVFKDGGSELRKKLQEACNTVQGAGPTDLNTIKGTVLSVSGSTTLSPKEKLEAVVGAINAFIYDQSKTNSALKDAVKAIAITDFGTVEQLVDCERACSNTNKDYAQLFSNEGSVVKAALQAACDAFDNAKPCTTYKNKINSAKSKIGTVCGNTDATVSPLSKFKGIADVINAVLEDATIAQGQKDVIPQAAVAGFGTIQDILDCYDEKK